MKNKPLTPYERWMVKSNLKTIESGEMTTENVLTVLRAGGYPSIADAVAKARLEYLRGELRAERLSYGEVAELQSLATEIDPADVELLEAAGVQEGGAS